MHSSIDTQDSPRRKRRRQIEEQNKTDQRLEFQYQRPRKGFMNGK